MMLSESFNRHRSIIDRFDDLVSMVAFRYGPSAQGIVFVLYDELIALRRITIEDPSAVVARARAWTVAAHIAESYAVHGFRPVRDHPSAVVGTSPTTVEFSREAFEEQHARVAHLVQAETVEVTDPELPFVQSGKPYMFVVDERGRFLVWKRHFSFEELVFGRNRATVGGVPVAHPMLVSENLQAIAAGEIVFIGSPRVRAVIVNNKSGHFRMPASCRSVIVDKCRDVLGLSEADMDVFIVGGVNKINVHRIGRAARREPVGVANLAA